MRKLIPIIFIMLFAYNCGTDEKTCQEKREQLNISRNEMSEYQIAYQACKEDWQSGCSKIEESYNRLSYNYYNEKAEFEELKCPKTQFEVCEEKQEELRQLGGNLRSKQDDYTLRIQELQSEQKPNIAKIKNVSFNEIQTSSQLKTALEIIRKADSYIEVFNQAQGNAKKAEEETWRLYHLTVLDCITLRSTDNDTQFADLLKQIDKTITNYQPQAEKLITPDNITPSASLEETWKKYQ